MTLNLIIVSPRNVFQCSDFRLSYLDEAGAVTRTTDHEAQKIVPVTTFDWSALVQFTGVARTARFDTSQWLGTLSSLVDMRAPLSWLGDRLLEVGQSHIGLDQRHTFSVAGFEGERPFITIVSNCQSFDADRLSVIPTSRRKWEATTRVGRHGAFATGATDYVSPKKLDALPRFARTHPTSAVHRKLAELNRSAARRAGVNGWISESCFTGHMAVDGSGALMPHDVNPGGEYLPKFATDRLLGLRLRPRTDGDGNPLPRRLVQMTIKRRNTPFGVAGFATEFQAIIEKVPTETDAESAS